MYHISTGAGFLLSSSINSMGPYLSMIFGPILSKSSKQQQSQNFTHTLTLEGFRYSKISKDGMWYVYNMPRSTRAFLFRPWESNDFKFTNIMQGKNQQKTWTLRNQVVFGRFVSSKKCYISTSRDGWNFTRVKPMCVRPFIGDPMNG